MARFILLMATLSGLLGAQAIRMNDPAAGKLLVSMRDLPDPNFSGTVVLLIEFSKSGAMGIVINHWTDVPISKALRGAGESFSATDTLFLGGPVERTSVTALVRTATAPPDSKRITDDIYVLAPGQTAERLRKAQAQPSRFRVYLGYAGWGPGQLENEVRLGAWHIFPADGATVFHEQNVDLWRKLIGRSENRIALR